MYVSLPHIRFDCYVPFEIFFAKPGGNLKFKAGKAWLRVGLCINFISFSSASAFENNNHQN